ncbi:MAG: hypothetical protein DBX47_04025 [Clostridiales bacterium]|nr:MAG: hypothetical protein DBX47_04025 [Clostridiales bacterium]
MKKLSAVTLIIIMIFSLTACAGQKQSADISVYNNAIKAFNEEPIVKMTVSSKLTITSDKSSTTKFDGEVYASHKENYIVSGDFDNTINTTSMPFSFYTKNGALYFVFFGTTFKADAKNDSDNDKIKSVVNSFSTDLFFGVKGETFAATEVTTSQKENSTEISLNIDSNSIDDTFKTSLKKLVDAKDDTNVSFSKISVICTVDSNGFPTQVIVNVDASTSSAKAVLESTLSIEKFSDEIPVPKEVDIEDYKDYDLDEIIAAVDMM